MSVAEEGTEGGWTELCLTEKPRPWSTLTLKNQQTLMLAFFLFLFNPFAALSAPTQWAQVQMYTPTACHPARGKEHHKMAARALATETLTARLEVQPAGRWPMAS